MFRHSVRGLHPLFIFTRVIVRQFFLSRVSMHSMQSALLFYQFCLTVRPSVCLSIVALFEQSNRGITANF